MKTTKITLVKKIILGIVLSASFNGFSQVGFGTTNPSNQASVDIKTTDKGLLIPRLTTVQRNTLGTTLTSAADSNNKGMQVFDTDTKCGWFWNGTTWVQNLDENSITRIIATNFSGTLQPYELVYIDPITASTYGKYYAMRFGTNLQTAADLQPIIGYVDSATPVSSQEDFYVQKLSKDVTIPGIDGTITQQIWYRPFLTPLWSSTRDNQNPCLFLGFAKAAGSVTGRRMSFDPKWYNTSNIISTTYKPILDNAIGNSASITAIGRYIVPATGLSGDFSSNSSSAPNKYADYNGNSFTYTLPADGDKAIMVSGTNIGIVYTYSSSLSAWVKKSQTTPLPTDNYSVANAYNANDLVINNGAMFQANDNIPANTAFAIGTTGATWKQIGASEVPNWTLAGTLSGVWGAVTTAPTFTGTTFSKNAVYYKQLGPKTHEVEVAFEVTNTSGTAGNGHYLFTLPYGLSFDQTILSQVGYTGSTSEYAISEALPSSSGGIRRSDPIFYYIKIVPYDATRYRVFTCRDNAGYNFFSSAHFQLTSGTMAVKWRFTFQSL
jgi:hypothetical protein